MRILVANKFWYQRGGLERVMFDEIEGLQQAGHEVVHFSTSHPLNLPSPYADYFAPYLELGAGASLSKGQQARAVVNLFYNREARRRFARLLADTRPDIVHVHGIHRQISPAILWEPRRRSIPVVQTLHDYHHVCPADVMLRGGVEPCRPRSCGRLNYFASVRHRCHHGSLPASTLSASETAWQRARGVYERTVTRFVSPSDFLAREMRDGGWTVPLDVVPNGVSAPRVAKTPPTWAALRGDELYFLVATRLSPEKGLEVALRAAADAGARLLVAGEGPQEGELRRRFPAATFLGHVSPAQVQELLAGCRAAVVPSTCLENAPLSVLEPMAAGRPVIASRLGGIPELLRDGVEGLLVPAGDVQAFTRAMKALAEAPDLAARLGAAARERAATEFSPQLHLTRLLAVYDKALGQAALLGSAGRPARTDGNGEAGGSRRAGRPA